MASDALTMEPEGDVAPVGELEVVYDEGTSPEKEAEVDRLIDENEARFAAEALTEDEIKAGLMNLSGGITTAQEVENAARSEEGLEPLLPLDFGPFNSDAALKAIFEKSAEVRLLQADYDEKKEAASDAKKELDIAAKALVNIIESLKHRRTQALNPSQPYLADVSTGATSGSSACPWERAHPGQVCPICSAAQAKDIAPALESAVHPEHEHHLETAQSAHLLVLAPIAEKLKAVNLFVTVDDLESLPAADLAAVESYASEPTVIPPHILTRCCVAAAPGSLMQLCQRCEIRLADETDRSASFDWYPEGALVGFDCDKQVATTDTAVSVPDGTTATDGLGNAVEPVRTIKARGSKKRAKKDPEQERVKQTDAGRKKAKTATRKARR